MKRRSKHPPDTRALRRQAAERLAKRGANKQASRPEEEVRLLHELEVHKIELELQNEQLLVTQNELEEGLDRYTQLFDFAPIGYATLGADGTVSEVNHVGANLLAEVRGRVIGRKFAQFVAPVYRQEFNDLLAKAIMDESRYSCDVELLRAVEDHPIVRITAASLVGNEATILLAFEDVTVRRNAEARLRRADEALREADRRKDEFLAMLSHELRTPLSSILMHSQLLQQGGMNDDDVKSSGAVIERAAKTQARLIDDLLDVSRIVAGKLTLKPGRVSPGTTVQNAVDAVAGDARKKNIALTVSIDPTVPAVTGDPVRLQQAVWNLLTNAVKFTSRDGRIHVTLDEVDRKVRIEVRDNGAGIERPFLPHLFERFSQADRTSTRSASGLGLGLSIAHSIIEAHQGTIHAESAGPGLGSTFTILLPPMGAPSDAPPAKAATATTRLEGARLLVVEDDAATRATLTHVLARAGAEVRDADSGAAAMKVLAGFKADVLLCDIAMPKEDGCSLLRRIRARERKRGGHVRALALTAFAGEENRARTQAAGFEGHLVKPVDIERLLTTISHLLSPQTDGVRGRLAQEE